MIPDHTDQGLYGCKTNENSGVGMGLYCTSNAGLTLLRHFGWPTMIQLRHTVIFGGMEGGIGGPRERENFEK